jgi:RNA polymerase sigma-70 factor (ECF subfamily)
VNRLGASAVANSLSPASAALFQAPAGDADRALVEALRAGEARAGEALFAAYAPYVRKVVTRVLGPDAEILDLVQDVFVIALESLHKLEDPGALRPWLAQIAVFRARGCIRKRQQWKLVRLFAPAVLAEARVDHADFEASEALVATYRLLSSLGADERIAFALRFIDGMELGDVADACGVSLATIKRRIARAQERFIALARREPALVDWIGGEL